MRAVFNRLMAVLAMLAFIGVISVQAIPSAEALGLARSGDATMADEHCPRMAVEHPDRGVPKPMPCKGLMPDCVKQMGCVGSLNLPSRSNDLQAPVYYSTMFYSSPLQAGAGLSIKPDLSPPIAS